VVARKYEFGLAVVFMILMVSAICAQEPAKEQFQSVVYVREAGADAQMYEKLRPHSLAMTYPQDFFKWGGKYLYMWYFPHQISYKEKPDQDPQKLQAFADDPGSVLWYFNRGMWERWDEYRAAGILTGERPERFEDLVAVSEEYARAVRDGVEPLPERLAYTYKSRQLGPLCFANPDAVRIMADMARFNAAHLWNNRIRKDGYMPVNAVFIDLDGLIGCPTDYSEFSRKKFEQWIRANYQPEEIRKILQVDPAQPLPILTPKGAPAEIANRFERLRREFYHNTLLRDYCHEMKKAVESVLGPDRFHFIYHGEGYWWRVLGGNVHNVASWGDWVDSYCSECAVTPFVRRGHYALPGVVSYRASDVNRNWQNSNNVYDYQYGAGRLWGEPVLVKAGYKGDRIGRNVATATLALAEGLALLGNMRVDAAREGHPGRKAIAGSYALPMVDFMHSITPQVRQMIPAARVGVVFSLADSWLYRGFNRPSNDTQAYQVSNILHTQHIPLQVAHLTILEQTLAQRPMDVLIVPWLRCVKDSQVAELEKFVRQGGKVVFIGECGTRTWEGLDREENAFKTILPSADQNAVIFRQVGKGRTAYIPGALDEKIRSAQQLHGALFELLGETPSCVLPDRYPLLLTNLTRNSNNSRFWMHLVNYDVDHTNEDIKQAIASLENVRVVVPLPEGLKATRATLYRLGHEGQTLPLESGREGCAVIVPRLDIYSLIAVATTSGQREQKRLRTPTTAAQIDRLVADGFNPPPTDKRLYAPHDSLSLDQQAHTIQTTNRAIERSIVVYLSGAGDEPVRLQYTRPQPRSNHPDIRIYGMDGKLVKPVAKTKDMQTTLSLPAMATGDHYSLVIKPASRRLAIQFLHQGGACFEASPQSPLTIEEEGDSAPLYFYVPKGCKKFKLYANTRPFWTQDILPVHLQIKDHDGTVRLNVNGPIDGGSTWEKSDRTHKFFDIEVPKGQAGRIWSLWLLDSKSANKKKSFVQFGLGGVPPVVAQSPDRLLIATGDE